MGLDHWGWFETPDKKFVGPGLAHLAVLPHLDWLRLGGCRIGNPAVEALAKIKSLQYVEMDAAGRGGRREDEGRVRAALEEAGEGVVVLLTR